MKKYLQLAVLIFRYGSLKAGTQNFNLNRAISLESLQEFVPEKFTHRVSSRQKSSRNTFLAQAAFIKSAFTVSGGHLCAAGLCYIRIPKAANTSLGYAMLAKQYPALKDRAVDETQINFLSDVNLRRDAGTEIFFTVVRNPFARLVSVYRDFFEKDHDDFMYADYLFGILKRSMSFAEFVDRISKIPDRLKDQHLKPQHLFLSPYERKGIAVKIFRLEDRQECERFLNDHGMELTHRNKSGDAYDYRQYYTPVLIKKVSELYRVDIERFGYGQVPGL